MPNFPLKTAAVAGCIAFGALLACADGGAELDGVEQGPTGTTSTSGGVTAAAGATTGGVGTASTGAPGPTSAGSVTTGATTTGSATSTTGSVPTGCAAGQIDCAGVCVDAMNDSANCGSCGNTCNAGSCVGGACSCPGGQLCGANCVDTLSDNNNCGGCGAACTAGQQCQSGACACQSGLVLCVDSCVDTQSDATNCGTCGNACAQGQVCSLGTCSDMGCGNGLTECNQSCVDTNTSVSNCGDCGNTCDAGQACENGNCQCGGGLADCGAGCVDVNSDASNCGACGNACNAGQSCSNGSCQCSGGQTDCSGSCVDTNTDADNCGTCGNSCDSGTCSNGTCTTVTVQTGVIGWASVSGDGVSTTTGGEGGQVTQVSNASQLQSAVSGTDARIVQLTSNISVSELDVGSNKTIEGVGGNITFSGSIKMTDETNVIVRNLHINASSAGGTGDGIHIQRSHHIWVDHVEIWDAPDGNLDINDASNWITISWSIFRYSANPPAADHRYSNLIGSGPAETQDDGRLKVTWHHNWWSERVHERMPRVRYGQIHVFNNLYTTSGNNYCIRAGYRSNIRIENNYFDGVGKPHEIDAGEGGTPIIVTATGNTYNNTSGAQDTSGTAFSPPYPYTLESPDAARTAIMANAGPQ